MIPRRIREPGALYGLYTTQLQVQMLLEHDRVEQDDTRHISGKRSAPYSFKKIYTCPPLNVLESSCSDKLTVNGTFIDSIKLNTG